MLEPKKEPYVGTLYFGHTGNHYVALKLREKVRKKNRATKCH